PPAAVQVERISADRTESPLVTESWADTTEPAANPFSADGWTAPARRHQLAFLPTSFAERSPRALFETDAAPASVSLPPAPDRPAREHTDTARELLLLANTSLAAPHAGRQGGTHSGPGRTPPLQDGFTETVWFRAPVNWSQATGMAWARDGSNRLFITRQIGEVRILQNGQLLDTPFATIRPIYTESECGLVGIAFDPNYTV